MQNRVVEQNFFVNTQKKKTTGSGFLVNYDVPIARSGILEYAGHEVGMPDKATVRAYRPLDTFTNEVMESARHLPVTNEHPQSLSVNTENARREVVGAVSEKVRLVGNEVIANSIVIFDAATINAVENEGKKELSIGFLANHRIEPGTTPDGESYDVVETIEMMNHVSVVNRGKAGSRYRLNSKEDDVMSTTEKSSTEVALTEKLINGVQVKMDEKSAQQLATVELLNSMQEAQAKSLEAMGGEIKTYLNGVTEQIDLLQAQVKEFVNTYSEKGEKLESDAEKEKSTEKVNEDASTEVEAAPAVNSDESSKQMEQLFTANSAPVKSLRDMLVASDNH